jgi:hypothetical protein
MELPVLIAGLVNLSYIDINTVRDTQSVVTENGGLSPLPYTKREISPMYRNMFPKSP